MKKKVLFRVLLGAPLGLALSYLITILISLVLGNGSYYPVVSALTAACGSEINAVLLQALCSLLYGAAWAGASAIWETDWSLLAQTVLHLAICSCATFPIAWLLHWMAHSLAGVALYFGIFLGIYLVIWLCQYSSIRRKLRKINQQLS